MEHELLRRDMVDTVRGRGMRNERICAVLLKIPRHEFVPPEMFSRAYSDSPLPIGNGQTISQPYMVGLMTDALDVRGHERVLEIGTGSGYQTAVLASLAAEIYSVERIGTLSEAAARRLERLGIRNVHLHVADGTLGWKDEAPFDRIIVTAAAPHLPQSLCAQLSEGGKMVIPLGDRDHQVLTLIERIDNAYIRRQLCGCVFVPLVGEEGWEQQHV